MDTATMWLLLFGAVALALLIAALTKTEFTVQRISIVGVMAALSFVAYEFFRIPFAGGSSFHLGNTFTALTAMLLDGVSGGLAGAIGLALADVIARGSGLRLYNVYPEVYHRRGLRRYSPPDSASAPPQKRW